MAQNLAIEVRENILFENIEFDNYIRLLKESYSINRKILLVQIPQLQFESFSKDIARNRCYYVFPPAGLQCISKALEARNIKVDILDLNYELLKNTMYSDDFELKDWIKILDKKLEKFNPSIIGTTCINVSKLFSETNPFNIMLEHIKSTKKHIVVVGGASIMNEYEEYLKRELCHFVIDGEGEDKVNYLLDKIFDENLAEATPQIYFKHHNKILKTKGADKSLCLHGNLISTYSMIPIEDYCKVGVLNHYSRMAGEDKPFATLQLGRGCRMNCKFCGVPKFMGRGVRPFPTSDIMEEVIYLVKKRGIRHFEWLDDDLLAKPDALKEVLKGIIELKKKYDITWAANNGLIAAFLNDEILRLMRDSGCMGFKIGIESGNPDILRKIRKPATIEKVLSACELINKYPEMFVAGNYIIGFFAEEPFWQMLDTFKFACKTNLDWSSISVFQFTSSEAIKQENLKKKDLGDTAVIPARYRPDGKVVGEELAGPEIFNINRDIIPSPGQVRQIWFAFNLIANYINNKNLMPNGKPEKFASWVEILEITYPHNAYMPLFSALAHVMAGNEKKKEQQLDMAKRNIHKDIYWKQRFEQFNLSTIMNDFPRNGKEVQEILNPLRERYSKWTK